jgi:hypothetical protein
MSESLCNELMGLYRSEGFLPALVDSLGLSNSNAFALALSNQITLKLSEGSQHREHQLAHRITFPGEREVVLHKLHRHTTPYQFPHNAQEVFGVACQSIHAVRC